MTIVTSGASLISSRGDLSEKLGGSVQKQLQEDGVEVLFGERVDFSSFEENGKMGGGREGKEGGVILYLLLLTTTIINNNNQLGKKDIWWDQ